MFTISVFLTMLFVKHYFCCCFFSVMSCPCNYLIIILGYIDKKWFATIKSNVEQYFVISHHGHSIHQNVRCHSHITAKSVFVYIFNIYRVYLYWNTQIETSALLFTFDLNWRESAICTAKSSFSHFLRPNIKWYVGFKFGGCTITISIEEIRW